MGNRPPAAFSHRLEPPCTPHGKRACLGKIRGSEQCGLASSHCCGLAERPFAHLRTDGPATCLMGEESPRVKCEFTQTVHAAEPWSDARTKMAAFFNGLLVGAAKLPLHRRQHDGPIVCRLPDGGQSRRGGVRSVWSRRLSERFLGMLEFELCQLKAAAYAG